MPYPICVVDGISPGIAKKLLAAKIRTTTKLLQAAGSPQGRKLLAEKTGLDAATILRCANMADRMRIKGVGREARSCWRPRASIRCASCAIATPQISRTG